MAYDPAAFERRRRAAGESFAAQSAMNEYARFIANQGGQRQASDYQRAIREQLPRLSSSFGQRGLRGRGVRSGVFNRALQSFGSDVQRQQSRFDQDLANRERQYQLQQTGFASDYERALADIEQDRANQIANTASSLLTLGLG